MNVIDYIINDARSRKVSVDRKRLENAMKEPIHPLITKDRGNTIIAEIKFKSPSERKMLSTESVEKIAAAYEKGGAAAVSVVTEQHYFDGSPEYLTKAKLACAAPILRKDFLVKPSQLEESKVLGADGVLLIAKILGENLPAMLAKADSLGLWSLVETHSAQEIEEAVAAGAKIIGVNNRDLDTLKVDLNTSVKLSAKIPDDLIFVVESGINGPKDIDYLKKNCARKPDAYLIGSSLMKAKDKTQAVKELVDA